MDDQLIDYLIEIGEAVEYGQPWGPNTTHEWWVGEDGTRKCRLVLTSHGGGCRDDVNNAEYVEDLLSSGYGVRVPQGPHNWEQGVTADLPEHVTHVIDSSGKPHRFRYYMSPPRGARGSA